MDQVYAVPDISCDHCKTAIEGEVNKLEGIAAVEVDVAGRTVHVVGQVSDEAVRAALDEAGYEATADA